MLIVIAWVLFRLLWYDKENDRENWAACGRNSGGGDVTTSKPKITTARIDGLVSILSQLSHSFDITYSENHGAAILQNRIYNHFFPLGVKIGDFFLFRTKNQAADAFCVSRADLKIK